MGCSKIFSDGEFTQMIMEYMVVFFLGVFVGIAVTLYLIKKSKDSGIL